MQETGHEVLVIGSGAGGGTVVHALTQAGVKVLLLEAGRHYDPVKEAAMFNWPKEAPLRASRTPDRPGGFYDATLIDMKGEPYTVAEGSEFYWNRARMLGGRTNHWGRNVPRYGPDDFKAASHTGYGMDWPLSYDDIESYYDKLEALMGVNGSDDDCWNSPSPNPETCQEPPAPRAYEMLFTKACEALGIPVVANPTAILTETVGDRSACFYATNCKRGCSIDAAFQSPIGFIKPALQTGNLTLTTNAMVYDITTDAGGAATGVRYIDKTTGQPKTAHAKIIVLAASAMESCRILLNSKSRYAPKGLANSSGLVGRNITSTPVCFWTIQIPALESLPPHNEDGTSQPHVVAPWWLHGDKDKKKSQADFFGGYRILPYGGGRMCPPDMYTFTTHLALKKGLYGHALKDHLRRFYGSTITLMALGSMHPNESCYCEIDPTVKDRWGIPVLKFHWQWSEENLDMAAHMHKSARAIIKKMNARIVNDRSPADGRMVHSIGGIFSHEIGGTTMGNDPRISVLNSVSQSWDVPNLYVADGAPFVTHAEKNPTLTIMALAWRAADNIIERLQAHKP